MPKIKTLDGTISSDISSEQLMRLQGLQKNFAFLSDSKEDVYIEENFAKVTNS